MNDTSAVLDSIIATARENGRTAALNDLVTELRLYAEEHENATATQLAMHLLEWVLNQKGYRK